MSAEQTARFRLREDGGANPRLGASTGRCCSALAAAAFRRPPTAVATSSGSVRVGWAASLDDCRASSMKSEWDVEYAHLEPDAAPSAPAVDVAAPGTSVVGFGGGGRRCRTSTRGARARRRPRCQRRRRLLSRVLRHRHRPRRRRLRRRTLRFDARRRVAVLPDRAHLAVAGELRPRGAALPCVFEDLASVERPLAFNATATRHPHLRRASPRRVPLEHAAAEAFCATNFAARLLVVKDARPPRTGARACRARGAGSGAGGGGRTAARARAGRRCVPPAVAQAAGDAIDGCDKCTRRRSAPTAASVWRREPAEYLTTRRKFSILRACRSAARSWHYVGVWEWPDGTLVFDGRATSRTSHAAPGRRRKCAEIELPAYMSAQ